LDRRRFLKYAGAATVLVGASTLGLAYLDQTMSSTYTQTTASGKHYPSELVRYVDESTNRYVWRLTDPRVLSYGAYFYQRSISHDNAFVIFRSNRSGLMNIFRVDLPSGTITQLTDEKWHVRDFVLSPNDEEVIYWGVSTRGKRSVKALHLADLSERTIYEVADEWVYGSEIGLSSDGRHAVISERWKADDIPSGDPVQQWAIRPLCRVVMMSTDGSESWVVHEEKRWLSHPQIRPGDNRTIMYCHMNPAEEIWLVNSDGSSVRTPRPETGREEITHEYWLADGSKIAYVHYPHAETWHEKMSLATIRSVDPRTTREETLMSCPGCSHCFSNKDNSTIVRDSQTDPFIYLVDVRAKKEAPLWRHDTSWKSYAIDSHAAYPNASFSPDASRVVFSTDKDGLPAVYLVTTP
jgi:oligogalacturonide lyase